MDYLRTALPCGTVLTFEDKQYLINSEVGRGGSCIVYDAEQISADGTAQIVRIKELYPAYENIRRNDDNSLIVPLESQKRFEAYFQRSRKAFAQNQQFRTTQGLINSTIDTTELYRTNGTVYSVMRCVEGCDYGKAEDDSIKSVLTRVLALSKVLKKYHENGYLHLDVKPENVFIIPETKEHIVLFDFDSLISFDELRSGNVVFSTSDGYTAPEVLHGQIRSIGVRADFYAVGALVYNKMFGESPKSLELNSKIDYSAIKFPDNRYQPLLFQKLSAFFRKTISVSPVVRYRSDDELIQAIEQLIGLSDVTGVQLISNFGYDSSTFVGRTDELIQISEAFDRSHIVFLSGIGGIGKTEIAKKYVKEHLNDLNRVVFCYYNDSIENAVCDSIQITECEPASDESRSDYFKRKLKVMKGLLTEQDIIIIDNFDVSSDENLDELLKCPCKFLITTREDYSQYDYEQIYVDCFADIEDAVTLFTTYDRHNYDSHQQECVKEIIELLERHTMTVELAAKYLDDSDILPSELLESLKTSSGITAADSDIEVSQRKDGKRSTRSITAHLLALFNMSGFSNSEKELIGSLSLMGNVFVLRKLFLEKFCSFPGNRGAMNKLIKTGWVKYDPASGRISLHQVIMDLVYNSLRPDAESCPHIVNGMGNFANEPVASVIDIFDRYLLFLTFLSRLLQNGNSFARAVVKCSPFFEENASYCFEKAMRTVHRNLLEIADQCCDSSLLGTKTRMDIFYIRIKSVIFDCYAVDSCSCEYESMVRYAQQYIRLMDATYDEDIQKIRSYLDLVFILREKTFAYSNAEREVVCKEKNIAHSKIFMDDLVIKAYKLILSNDTIEIGNKLNYLWEIRFYFTGRTRQGRNLLDSDIFSDREQAAECLKEIQALTSQYNLLMPIESNGESHERWGFNFDSIYTESVVSMESTIDYARVIECEKIDIELLLYLSLVSYQLGNLNESLTYAEKAALYDTQKSPSTSLILAYAYISNGYVDKAIECCKNIVSQDSSHRKSNMMILSELKAYYILYYFETDATEKANCWEQCVQLYGILDRKYCDYDDVFGSFFIEYHIETSGIGGTVKDCYEMIKEHRLISGALCDFVFQNSDSCGLPEYKVLLSILIADKTWVLDKKLSKEYINRAQLFYDSFNSDSLGITNNYICYAFAEYGFITGDSTAKEYAKNCNFYLIGEYETKQNTLCESLLLWEHLESLASHFEMREQCTMCYRSFCKQIEDNIDDASIQPIFEDFYYSTAIRSYSSALIEGGNIQEGISEIITGSKNIYAFFNGKGFVPESNDCESENHSNIPQREELIYHNHMNLLWYIPSDEPEPYYKHGIVLVLICCIIRICNRCDESLLSAFVNPDISGMDRVYKALCEAFHSSSSGVFVNAIYELYLYRLPKNFGESPEFQRFAKLFEDYFARNSTDDFDFKR